VSFATLLEGVLNVSQFKKIAILSGAISIGAAAFVIVERRSAGQTTGPDSRSIGTQRLGLHEQLRREMVPSAPLK
jgi:hypothetical protein